MFLNFPLVCQNISACLNSLDHAWLLFVVILYSYLVGCCPISDLFGKESRYWAKLTLSQYLSLLPNKSDIGQAADQTTVLLFPPRILVYVSLTIMRSNYIKTYKPFIVRSISRWFDQQRVGWQKSGDVISGHLGCHISEII